jgi:hypothetical protein
MYFEGFKMSLRKELLINHICLSIKDLSTLIATIALGDLSDEQIITGINKLAMNLKMEEGNTEIRS